VYEGTPTGKVEIINNLQTYIAAPKDGSKAKSIVFLVDIFGWEFKNIRLLADNFAQSGFYCYVPDVHQGDSIPLDFLNSVEPPLKVREKLTMIEKTKATATVGTTLPPWLVKHRESISKVCLQIHFSSMGRKLIYLQAYH
jgi:dienelactone hydrolase